MLFSNTSSFGGKKLVDPKSIIETLGAAGYNPSHIVGRANSFTLPRGFRAGLGWILMQSKDLAQLEFGDTHTLQLVSIADVNIEKLVIVGYESITAGRDIKDDSVVLVHIADARFVAEQLSGYMPSPGNACNVHTPDYEEGIYYKLSKLASPFTWTSLINWLWSRVPLLPAPDYAKALFPEKDPQGFDFQGWTAWECIRNVLESINHTIVVLPNGTTHVVALGNTTILNDTELDSYNQFLFDDLIFQHNSAVYRGRTTVTHFENHDYAFFLSTNLEEATPKTYKRHRTIKSLTANNIIGGNVDKSFPNTYNHSFSSIKALYDHDGTPVNSSELNDEAQNQADQISNRGNDNPFHRIYKGWHNLNPLLDGFSSISWWDYGVGIDRFSSGGAFTEFCLLPYEPPSTPLFRVKEPTYYSPGKHPGPPDLATPHIETEYLCVARPNQLIIARDARDTYFRYGILDPIIGLIDWRDSPAHHTPFHTLSKSRIHYPGENYPGLWHQQVRKWLLLDGEQIVLVRADEFMEPGQCCTASIGIPNDGEWSVGPQCILQDGQHRTFCAPNDTVWAKPMGSTSDGVMVVEAIGENGLDQIAKVISDVSCGNPANLVLSVGAPNKTYPSLKISDKTAADYKQARMGLRTIGGCQVNNALTLENVCPEFGTTRKLFQGEYVPIKYNSSNRTWTYKPKPQTLHGHGQIATDMCQDGIFTYNNVLIGGDNCTNLIEPLNGLLAVNLFNLKAKAGDDLYTQFDGVQFWWIIQVRHHTKVVLLALAPNNDCGLTVQIQSIAAQICEDPTTEDVPFGVSTDVFSQIQFSYENGECKLTGTKKNVCVLKINSSQDNVEIGEFEEVIVVTDIYDDDPDISACFVPIYSPCVGEPFCEPVLTTTDCSGSGSQ